MIQHMTKTEAGLSILSLEETAAVHGGATQDDNLGHYANVKSSAATDTHDMSHYD